MQETQKPKIAIVHDHLGFGGGGERTVLLLALELNADFITAYVSPNTYPEYQKKLGDKLKILARGSVEMRVVRFFWLRNLFWRKRKLFKNYDILIASSQTATEAVANYSRKNASRIVYTHTTPRRVFDLYDVSKHMVSGPASTGVRCVCALLEASVFESHQKIQFQYRQFRKCAPTHKRTYGGRCQSCCLAANHD